MITLLKTGDRPVSPKVKIYPGMLGVYWMEVEHVGPRVKVKPVRIEGGEGPL